MNGMARPLDAAPVIKHVTIDHHVVHGDTLWDLAEKYYGEGQRYPEIFEANRGVTQGDGRALSDPDLIITGWTLAVPNVQVEEAPPAPAPDPVTSAMAAMVSDIEHPPPKKRPVRTFAARAGCLLLF